MYYSSQLFVQAGVSTNTAILASLGAGVINFFFAFPGLKVIDTWGRRPLLLFTLPLMGLLLFFIAFSFFAAGQEARLGLIST